VAALGACLVPPDIKVAPEVNEPVSIDRTLLETSPDDFHVWPGCPDRFELDIEPALDNPDDDDLTIVWIVNYQAGLRQTLDDIDTTVFSFDPCTHPKVIAGGSPPNKIEVLVFDRKPLSLNNADDARQIADPETTWVGITWFLAVEDLTCCAGP